MTMPQHSQDKPNTRSVLVVADDPLVSEVISEILGHHGYQSIVVNSGQDAVDAVRSGFRGPVLLDLWLPDMSGQDVFVKLRQLDESMPVIFLTGHGTTELALESIQTGAFEFLDKADITERLLSTVDAASDHHEATLRGREVPVDRPDPFGRIIGDSPQMRSVFRSLENALDSRLTVLIRGESGTGKELIARAIHDGGPRRHGPFVTINCASIPETLLESELFGYERGAFTGAAARKQGRFELARGGTLFLDEIGEMHPTLQAKLLRVIQDRQFQRLGGVETISADVRIISATHRNLEEEVAATRFREDLYYRLAVFMVVLPPLRARTGDVPLLVDHLASEVAKREHRDVLDVDRRALEVLCAHRWPGNVRELENVISFAVISSKTPVITIADLPPHFVSAARLGGDAGAQDGEVDSLSQTSDAGIALPQERPAHLRVDGSFATLAELEAAHIRRVLDHCRGNKTKAARSLGIGRTTMYRKIEELGLE